MLTNLTILQVQEMYLDRINNFLTDERFAEYYEISLEEARVILSYGNGIQELYAALCSHLNLK